MKNTLIIILLFASRVGFGQPQSDPFHLTAFKGEVFLGAHTETGSDIWKSDGTEGGTFYLKDITNPKPK